MDYFKKSMVKGELKAGQQLPSGRDLSTQMHINPNTAARVYKELEQEGYCYTQRGVGTFVTDDMDIIKELKIEMAKNIVRKMLKDFEDMGISNEEAMKVIKKEGGM